MARDGELIQTPYFCHHAAGLCSNALAFANANVAFALAFDSPVMVAFALACDSSAFAFALAFDSNAFD